MAPFQVKFQRVETAPQSKCRLLLIQPRQAGVQLRHPSVGVRLRKLQRGFSPANRIERSTISDPSSARQFITKGSTAPAAILNADALSEARNRKKILPGLPLIEDATTLLLPTPSAIPPPPAPAPPSCSPFRTSSDLREPHPPSPCSSCTPDHTLGKLSRPPFCSAPEAPPAQRPRQRPHPGVNK